MKGYEELFQEKQYAQEDISNAALIIHPRGRGYNIKAEELFYVFEEGSNLAQLENSIEDDFGNIFRDSEGYYMASRTDDLEIKKGLLSYQRDMG